MRENAVRAALEVFNDEHECIASSLPSMHVDNRDNKSVSFRSFEHWYLQYFFNQRKVAKMSRHGDVCV